VATLEQLLDAHQLAHAHPSGSSADIIADQILPFAPEPFRFQPRKNNVLRLWSVQPGFSKAFEPVERREQSGLETWFPVPVDKPDLEGSPAASCRPGRGERVAMLVP
jgi:hypothetical protein